MLAGRGGEGGTGSPTGRACGGRGERGGKRRGRGEGEEGEGAYAEIERELSGEWSRPRWISNATEAVHRNPQGCQAAGAATFPVPDTHDIQAKSNTYSTMSDKAIEHSYSVVRQALGERLAEDEKGRRWAAIYANADSPAAAPGLSRSAGGAWICDACGAGAGRAGLVHARGVPAGGEGRGGGDFLCRGRTIPSFEG